MSTTNQFNGRLAAIDGLRFIMAFLGILIHSATGYMTNTPYYWPVVNGELSVGLDLLAFTIHLFRMEVDFLIAGFCGALIVAKRGVEAFAMNRFVRVLLPLVIGTGLMMILVPIASGQSPFSENNIIPYHLWFLLYLCFFYLGYLLIKRIPERFYCLERQHKWLNRLLRSQFAIPLLALITVIPAYFMQTIVIETPFGLLPKVRFLLYYGFFFYLGWQLCQQQRLILALSRRPLTQLVIAGVLTLILALDGSVHGFDGSPLETRVPFIYRYVYAICCWLYVGGIIGVGVRAFRQPTALLAYLANMAYWIYLAHIPIVLFLQYEINRTPFPSLAKYLCVVTGTSLILWGLHHYVVRKINFYRFFYRKLEFIVQLRKKPLVTPENSS